MLDFWLLEILNSQKVVVELSPNSSQFAFYCFSPKSDISQIISDMGIGKLLQDFLCQNNAFEPSWRMSGSNVIRIFTSHHKILRVTHSVENRHFDVKKSLIYYSWKASISSPLLCLKSQELQEISMMILPNFVSELGLFCFLGRGYQLPSLSWKLAVLWLHQMISRLAHQRLLA